MGLTPFERSRGGWQTPLSPQSASLWQAAPTGTWVRSRDPQPFASPLDELPVELPLVPLLLPPQLVPPDEPPEDEPP